MEATQPARLGDFEFDAIIKRPETLSSKIPGYATEEGLRNTIARRLRTNTIAEFIFKCLSVLRKEIGRAHV